MSPALLRLGLLATVLTSACAGPAGPGPQEATFPPGQRVARAPDLAVELTSARYDLREVSLQAKVTNRGTVPVVLDRQGILLEYRELEFPISELASPELAAETTVAPGEHAELTLGFVTEQALVEAATLHVMSIRRGGNGEPVWLEPLRLPVPPPAAFVEAAQPAAGEP